LLWAQSLLIAAALVLLGYYGFSVADAWIYQHRQGHNLDRLLDRPDRASAATGAPRDTDSQPNARAAAVDGLIGRIDIPRLGLSVVVAEGVDYRTLRRAVGHIRGTALPGQTGNVALSGHRDTYFRPLRDIERDDIIMVTTLDGEYHYRVVSTKIVSPDEASVLDSSDRQTLTLITCYPFYFVGPAPNRFIVLAERIA
jgi:sortase A